jgi:hypothetical protein
MTDKGILYIGPQRVNITMGFFEGILAIIDENDQVLGYPSIFYGRCVIRYPITHLPTHLQAAFRNPKILETWSAYMVLDSSVWNGELEYEWTANVVYAHLIMES